MIFEQRAFTREPGASVAIGSPRSASSVLIPVMLALAHSVPTAHPFGLWVREGTHRAQLPLRGRVCSRSKRFTQPYWPLRAGLQKILFSGSDSRPHDR